MFVMSGALVASAEPPPGTPKSAPPTKWLYETKFSAQDARRELWKPRETSKWSFADPRDATGCYRLEQVGQPGKIRAPFSWSVWQGAKPMGFVATTRAKCLTPVTNLRRDVIIVFAWRDPEHFDYVHFSAQSDEFHNVVMKVEGADRKPLPHVIKPVARLTTEGWHDLRVWVEAPTGTVRAYADDMTTPILQAVDPALAAGLVGIGSFDDTAEFASFSLATLDPRPTP
jgi:hypothetical protein